MRPEVGDSLFHTLMQALGISGVCSLPIHVERKGTSFKIFKPGDETLL
jgi:hypothetical protein